ncbi:hypothetical protein Tco_1162544 [Tanacetum coccineum]
MKEMLHQRMFESGTYKSLPEHIAVYEALEASLARAQRDKFLGEKDMSHKRRRDDQDPPLSPPPHDLDLTTTYQAPAENSLLEKTRDMRTFMNWYCQKMGKTKLTQADLEDKIDWANPEGDQVRIDISRPLPLCSPPVRTHMRILSVVSLKAYSRYGYDYLKEITLRRADYQEYTIAERDFKNLYPRDFEDLNLLLQGHLKHPPGSDKRMLSTAINQWTRNLVIRQRVEDFQLGIESYHKQLNLTKPGWDAKGYEYKHDYTIIEVQ